MTIEIKIPELGESISEATIGKWLKNPGDKVEADEPIVALETDKVAIEVPAPSDGFIGKHLFKEGDTVEVGTIIGTIGDSEERMQPTEESEKKNKNPIKIETKRVPSPSAQRIIAENKVDINVINGSGRDGQILKQDVMKGVAEKQTQSSNKNKLSSSENEEIVPMTKLRQTIANRLKEVQNTAAILTTFNEVDMTNVLKIREKYKDKFQEKYNVKLGFMGFFSKACIEALKKYPAVNSEVRGTDIVYKKYINIGIAVATEKGLCVPVVKNAEELSIPEIEIEVLGLGTNARNDTLKIDDMQGGTFTITNGGIYGSMMSTPILNPPQSAILGMHKIEKRPVVIHDKIEIRSMMYLALSYDHRVIDGAEAVSFLEYIRKCIDDPADYLIDLF
ncbi:MAG: dihydrolipoyllysine-residue succinyltransferase [Rhodobiaceae bacterium]|nr:dihydrolipoyllysine-residue succinyltransferase [Rhodobiaceae bacterium]|tara:strand:+ start:34244 stop:35416 length:1173 start_codon:yes stop_codon:yes gene_type:complete